MRMHTQMVGLAWLIGSLIAHGANAQDVPDPYFIDSNGDGIDGELNQAVFVAPPPLGNNGNSGLTPATPVATIGMGLQLAQVNALPQVLVQVGTYNESLTLVSGVGLYGGFDANWARVPSTATVATIVQGGATAVLGQNLTLPTTVSFLTLRSANAANPGESSYAVRLVNSPGPLVLRYNRIEPGTGATGIDASDAPPRSPAQAQGGTDGQNAAQSTANSGLQGGPGGSNASCPNASNIGGQGGTGGVGETGLNGQTGVDGSGGADGGGGGVTSTTSMADGADGGNGQSGTAGAAGAPGSVAMSTVGAIDGNALYIPPQGSAGSDGAHGTSGAGGGGGGGQDCAFGCNPDLGASGGGGGAGGCGGFAAQSGGSGGASLGIVVDSTSNATISHNHFKLAVGGSGGDGGDGGTPQTGGAKGAGGLKEGTDGGNGGDGGIGGSGGTGGSGAGGHGGAAIGILDPLTRADIDNLRYTQAPSAALPGVNGVGNPSTPLPGTRSLRHPTAAAALPTPQPALSSYTILEPLSGTATRSIPITLTVPSQDIVSAGYTVADGSAQGAGVDYTLANGAVPFNPWTTQASIDVQVHADAESDSGETFTITLAGAVIGPPATITILEERLFADSFD